MRKHVIIATILGICLMASCALHQGPSVCDTVQQPSLLCEIAEGKGVKIEEVGATLVLLNAVAIGEGAYTIEEAVLTLRALEEALQGSISYAHLRKLIYDTVRDYPGLYVFMNQYLDLFLSDRIIYEYDRLLLIDWISDRIQFLEELK